MDEARTRITISEYNYITPVSENNAISCHPSQIVGSWCCSTRTACCRWKVSVPAFRRCPSKEVSLPSDDIMRTIMTQQVSSSRSLRVPPVRHILIMISLLLLGPISLVFTFPSFDGRCCFFLRGAFAAWQSIRQIGQACWVGARQQGHHSDDKIRCDTELSCRWQIIDDGYFLLTVGGREMTWWV